MEWASQGKSMEYKFYLSFLEFFQNSQSTSWDETEVNLPEELASIAAKIFFQMINPITDVFIKNGTKEEYETAYRKILE